MPAIQFSIKLSKCIHEVDKSSSNNGGGGGGGGDHDDDKKSIFDNGKICGDLEQGNATQICTYYVCIIPMDHKRNNR